MRILFCGDRNWSHYKTIVDVMLELRPTLVIEGEAAGADSMAREAAEDYLIAVLPFPADWKKYGRAAGPIRNSQMLKEGKPELVVAFHDDITTSKGTKNMVEQAKKNGIKVLVYNSKGECYYESVVL